MEKKDIPYLSTAELADLIRQKEVSPVEVTESYLERIADRATNIAERVIFLVTGKMVEINVSRY